MREVACLSALFPETRFLLLQSFLTTVDRAWYFAELANALGKAPSSLQRELKSLVRVGLLDRRVKGRKVYFQVNAGSPYFVPLRDLFAVQKNFERKA